MKKHQQANHKTPPTHGENFPFPMPETAEDLEDWIGRKQNESVGDKELLNKTTKPLWNSSRATDEVTLVSYDAVSPQINPAQSTHLHQPEVETAEFDFDAEKAIIYTEIMTPKYVDAQ